MDERIKIFSGTSNLPLAREICDYLGVSLGEAEIKTFSDGEVFVELKESVRGKDVYVIQSTHSPGNNLIELLIMLDTLKRASAAEITAIIPYYGYARQDRKVSPRSPISAKLVANLITVAGADRVVCMDLHAGQIQGFFDIPVDNLYATPILLPYIRRCYSNDDLVIVSPDAGGVERARAFAKRLDTGLAIIDKRRTAPNVAEAMHIIGEVENRVAVILDDMIDTAGTVVQAAEALKRHGARRVYACATHPVLSGRAVERLRDSCIEEVIVTNTIPLREEARLLDKIKVLSVGPLLGEAIKRIHSGHSVSSLFV